MVSLEPAPVLAQRLPGDVRINDVLDVLLLDRELLAIDAAGGGQTTLSLRLAEEVLWKNARGKIGIVVTTERILAVASNSASWQEVDYRAGETPPKSAMLGDRVALITTSKRILGFDGGSGNLIEYRLGVREEILIKKTGRNVAIIVTTKHALGLSPFTGGFFPTPIFLGDEIEGVAAESNVATLTSNRRILIFRATTGTWEERRRRLN